MSMSVLSADEVRVLGCLLEKETTTPDLYPLTLNSLLNACNQKSNREPVVNYTESQLEEIVSQLIEKALITDVSSFGSRASKYQHRFCNTEFSDLQLTEQERAVVCLLFLRGPQTPGELKSRSGRLCQFDALADVDKTLQSLISKTGGPYVVQMSREPGKRESRFAHCFSGEVTSEQLSSSPSSSTSASELEERVAELERQVAFLQEQLAAHQNKP